MKSKLYLITLIALLFMGCKKWLPENRIVGTWRLVEVQKRRLLERETLILGFENGLFTFNSNLTASYTDPLGTMTGNWSMRQVSGGYYDSNGVWQSDDRTIFTLYLVEFSGNRVLDWTFDAIDFRDGGNKLFATVDGRNYNFRYDFRRQ